MRGARPRSVNSLATPIIAMNRELSRWAGSTTLRESALLTWTEVILRRGRRAFEEWVAKATRPPSFLRLRKMTSGDP